MRHHSQRDSCNCCCDPAAAMPLVHPQIRARDVVVYSRERCECIHTYLHRGAYARTHVQLPVPYYPGSELFHYGKSRLHFFTSPNDGVSNLENRVEGGPSNHVFLAIVSCVDPRHPRFSSRRRRPFIPAPACPHPWTQSSSRENGEPFIRRL